MISLGDKAPQFILKDSALKEVDLSSLVGQWVVLYFYPKDNTPGCTTEALQFTALQKEFAAASVKVFGISKDTCESHAKFTKDHDLKVDLLSDPTGVVVIAYDSFGEKNNYGKISMGILRTTVVISPDQVIAYIFKNVRADGHAEKVLEKITILGSE